ncbi:TPA: Holliday junction resolvase RuvX [Patescibacteria group bacterium]|uniref:Putative pre-16S rRNA nuclease n=2 Tax=Bacteria division Kazan-3B-28 TaxID=1798534 RepID=A0A0G1X854_UNCK3|nr:MAG: putative Holliday junction resolvase [candidate division Kazan bacterium GW2011_GWA1_50_15]KKW25825.1 MAG: Holliday junction resolvase YqgF [candidate division Kazan bacterium GW2011_GWC1_52_13]KKW27161.1 MAG: Holliday junction resolvase YqgF [candidate division Kazan bacterium GW2011_GWB1_52_7]HCL47841.1 Holliday junction resolvase RuvX [Patescibacteria group bacterium]HCR42449.1 Holliday junction resolvase RuvX [Patescibacteria group bacterium]
MTILGLDIGDRRVGVALVELPVRIVRPLTTLANNRSFLNELVKLWHQHHFGRIVIGWPKHLNGQDSAQSKHVQLLAAAIQKKMPDVELIFEDERLTSREATARLRQTQHERGDIDAVSAQIILESWLFRQNG